MLHDETDVPLAHIEHEVAALKHSGYRFVTMTCLDAGETFHVLYHFDKQYEMKHLKVACGKDRQLPSISHIFFAAVLIENEIQDLFGLKISGLAIDYKGRFLLAESAPKAPMCKSAPAPSLGIDIRVKQGAEGGAVNGA